jgi:hypothetical protein
MQENNDFVYDETTDEFVFETDEICQQEEGTSDEDIVLELTPEGVMRTRPIPADKFYEKPYSDFNLPRQRVRYSQNVHKRFRGVRGCGKDRALSTANRLRKAFVKRQKEKNPSLTIIRSGWETGKHYENNLGGGGQARRCNGWVDTTVYIEFLKPKNLEVLFGINNFSDFFDDN